MKLQNSKKIPYHTRSEIFETIFQGGMPDVVSGAAERNAFFKSYVSTYIEKDVRKLINASNELQFRNFISIAALRTAQELHYDEIAGSVGIDVRTCKRWISILETSGLSFFCSHTWQMFPIGLLKLQRFILWIRGFVHGFANGQMPKCCPIQQ